jgi:hypothetical protein
MDKYLLAENPLTDNGDLAIIKTVDPIAIIGIKEGHNLVPDHPCSFWQYGGEKYTLYVHHLFTTKFTEQVSNIAFVDVADNSREKLVKKELRRAWKWFEAYLIAEDELD